MKRVIVILLTTVFIVNYSMADTSALPTYEQAVKLVSAAWKSPPISIDVTYYSTVKDNTRTQEKLRQIYKGAFDEEYGPDEELSSEMLERKERDTQMNVDNALAEQQQGGTKAKFRVRTNGNSYRIDRVFGSQDRTILQDTAQEQFQPGKKLDANTPFEQTFIETPTATNSPELYIYYHVNKVATIEKIESSRTAVEDRKISEILMIPNALILQMKLGTRLNNVEAEPYDINEPNIKRLCSGTLEGISVKIRPDENEPVAKDRIEISLYNKEKIEFYTSLMICDRDDYSKVYYCQTPNPATNKPLIFTRKCSNFDVQGIPYNVTEVQYDGKGNVLLQETYQIEDIRINVPIPKEVFEFNPPKDYEVTDFRLTDAQRQAAKIENLKKRLKDENSGRRLEALVTLRELLKDNAAELKTISISMLGDDRNDIRRVALVILRTLLKDNPEELKNIANSMQNDEDRAVQSLVTNILKEVETKN
jgi:hypothetical protein